MKPNVESRPRRSGSQTPPRKVSRAKTQASSTQPKTPPSLGRDRGLPAPSVPRHTGRGFSGSCGRIPHVQRVVTECFQGM
uniref:Uncharacterized protein n=1 Tax=Rousettus aegyptiacus TaxID=9407 RepID=A0A7J8GAG7_ROUAE|nr:hypothetical protein HJG63_011587 [Rousettus aegyptiacus]